MHINIFDEGRYHTCRKSRAVQEIFCLFCRCAYRSWNNALGSFFRLGLFNFILHLRNLPIIFLFFVLIVIQRERSGCVFLIHPHLRLVVDLQTCVKAQQSRAYAQKVKISNLQQMARTVAYVQEHGYDSYEKLSETADTIYTKMAKARGDAKLTESKLRKTNEQIHYLGQYLSTKSIYGEFLKAPNKKIFRQAHSDELAQYEEALQILKQHSPDGKFPTMKDLRAEKEQLTIQKDAQYDTYRYFKDYHKELQTVCANVDSILGAEQEVQQHEQQHTRKYEPSL